MDFTLLDLLINHIIDNLIILFLPFILKIIKYYAFATKIKLKNSTLMFLTFILILIWKLTKVSIFVFLIRTNMIKVLVNFIIVFLNKISIFPLLMIIQLLFQVIFLMIIQSILMIIFNIILSFKLSKNQDILNNILFLNSKFKIWKTIFDYLQNLLNKNVLLENIMLIIHRLCYLYPIYTMYIFKIY